MIEKLRDLWYGLAARRTIRKTSKPPKNPYASKNMQHVSGLVETVWAFKVLTLRGSGAYPVYIKVSYTVDCAVYCKREVRLSTEGIPCEGASIPVAYPKAAPRKAVLIV